MKIGVVINGRFYARRFAVIKKMDEDGISDRRINNGRMCLL
jgi:hypothetical protein